MKLSLPSLIVASLLAASVQADCGADNDCCYTSNAACHRHTGVFNLDCYRCGSAIMADCDAACCSTATKSYCKAGEVPVAPCPECEAECPQHYYGVACY
ncbi:hypothetical protein BST61_g2974 [Cercospora zeina]